MLNWKYIKTPAGRVSFAACQGEKLVKEFNDVGYACHYEKDFGHQFKESIDIFMEDQKRVAQAKMDGKYINPKIGFVRSHEFRALQKRLEKKEKKNDI